MLGQTRDAGNLRHLGRFARCQKSTSPPESYFCSVPMFGQCVKPLHWFDSRFRNATGMRSATVGQCPAADVTHFRINIDAEHQSTVLTFQTGHLACLTPVCDGVMMFGNIGFWSCQQKEPNLLISGPICVRGTLRDVPQRHSVPMPPDLSQQPCCTPTPTVRRL